MSDIEIIVVWHEAQGRSVQGKEERLYMMLSTQCMNGVEWRKLEFVRLGRMRVLYSSRPLARALAHASVWAHACCAANRRSPASDNCSHNLAEIGSAHSFPLLAAGSR